MYRAAAAVNDLIENDVAVLDLDVEPTLRRSTDPRLVEHGRAMAAEIRKRNQVPPTALLANRKTNRSVHRWSPSIFTPNR